MAAVKIWNTGIDAQGSQLAPGSIDPHWRLIQGPGVTRPQRTYVLADQKAGNYFQTSDSMWVWADPSGRGETNSLYVFGTEFYNEVDLLHWIQISGSWGADNFGQLTIDGMPLPPGSHSGQTSLPPGNVGANYQQEHAFIISQAHHLSLSQLYLPIGWHTLEVWVYNEGGVADDDPTINPAGFNLTALHVAIESGPFVPILHR